MAVSSYHVSSCQINSLQTFSITSLSMILFFFCLAVQTATNCSVDNGGCDHECLESEDGLTRSCSCITGYKLHDDSRKCVPNGENTLDVLLFSQLCTRSDVSLHVFLSVNKSERKVQIKG